jgi:hypothetical protein
VQTHEARQQPASAEIDGQRAAGEDLGETRALAGHDQVAAERQIHARPHGVAAHLGDAGLRHLVQGDRGGVDGLHGVQGMHTRRHVFAQLGPGTEGAPRAGDDQDAIALGLRDLLEDAPQLLPHVNGDGVLHPGPIERHRHDAALGPLHENVLGGPGSLDLLHAAPLRQTRSTR